MKDPFDILRAELVQAADRAALPAPRERWGWLRRPSRPVAIFLAALVITGSAAAAVFSLGSASQPLVGKVPGAITPASRAGYRYALTVIPGLAAGAGGWQSFIVYSRAGITSHEFSPVAGYPTATNPFFTFSGFPDRFARGETVAYVLTSPRVLAVRIGSRTIRTFGSPDLPTGDRAAVFFIPAKNNISTTAILPLDRSGQVITVAPRPTGGSGSQGAGGRRSAGRDQRGRRRPAPPGSLPVTWMAPNAVTRWWPLPGFTVPYHHPGYHGRTHPGPGVCELAQHGLPALHAEFGHTIATISPDPDALGQLFVSCVDTEYYLHGWPLQAGVLLDGRQPGQVLRPIPGARPVPAQPHMVNLPAGRVPWNYGSPVTADSPQFSLTAKRVGNAWLVAQGGSGLAQRVQVLNSLRISKLDMYHVTSGPAPH